MGYIEVKGLSLAEKMKILVDKKRELADLHLRKSLGNVNSNHAFKLIRKYIARLMTSINSSS